MITNVLKMVISVILFIFICAPAFGKTGDKCHGEGRGQTCEEGEFCREGFCTRVYLRPPGCKEFDDCPNDFHCYNKKCIAYITDEDRKILAEGRMKLKKKMEVEEKRRRH
ncbi:uncharacterized protein LOC111696823 [Eurytemora carolleeae]|uniref:uncharacterized protein LOC111696823 n=1 Tax=Eurytemora carolleeae TaxID=1294199 RepID=UPI000C793F79|nr:uncharacterized protein LOC111696823 [Eurytemora carolleeae]|eukprot:XP_023322337.1 uncharacterized protein LOC111696823 [Eurytemora affinis]